MHGFELLRKVAEGSAAEAFLARAPGSKHSVLVEVSRAEVVEDMELYGRFLDRAMGRRQFQHPHLVQRHTAGCGPDGRVYVATEPIEGPTIADKLAGSGPYEPHEAVRLVIPICAALWSQPAGQVRSIAIGHVVAFMNNHGMLSLRDRPEWRVIEGGSQRYLDAFTRRFRAPVLSVPIQIFHGRNHEVALWC